MTLSTRSSISRTTLISTLCLLVLFSLVVFNTSCFSVRRPDLAWLDYDHDAASLTEATRVPKIISEAVDLPTNVHTFRDDGEVTVGTGAHRHPVLEILEHASSKWQSLLHAHGGDQTHAFLQYRAQRFEKTPAVSRASSRIPQLDLFTPISASLLAPRQREAEILPDTFTLVIRSGVPSIIYGNLTSSVSDKHRARRAELLLHAIHPFVNDLPDLRATFNVLPQPRHALSSHSVEVLAALSADRPLPNSPVKFLSQVEPTGMNIGQGRPIHADDLKQLERTMKVQEHWSWENACHAQADAPGEEEDTRDDLTPPIRFVALPEARSDLCLHRALPKLPPVYESIYTTYHTRLSPVISETTATWASDVLLPPLDFFAPEFRKDVASTMPWDNKAAGLFWRGAPTEVPHVGLQLQRLIAFTQNTEEHDIILPGDNEGFLIDRKQLADIVNFNIQQGREDPEAEAGWKFLIELGDGAQMQTKMASGALVFRPLLLSDWVSEHSVPWVHYIPVQPDLSDLPSLMAFFERHDALARRIADAGQAWAREQLSHARAREDVKEVLEGWARLGL